jgi:ribosomal protein S12 methylthiotransferase accessory factor
MTASLDHADALARARTLVDDRFGVIRQLIVHEVGPSDPPVFCATAQLASTRRFSDVEASRLNGGAALDRGTAMMGALGEAIERYALGLYRECELVRGSFRELESVALDPRRLIFFADEQYASAAFPYVRYEPAVPLSWVRGRSLFDARECLVPAPRAYTPYRAPSRAECFMQSTSTGAACHVDRDRAVLAALYECIERDGVMIAWLNRLSLPRVDAASLEEDGVQRFLAWLADADFSVDLFDATTDLALPTAICILSGPSGRTPALAVGAATRATLAAAAVKALIESAHTFFWIHTRCRGGRAPAFREDYADVTSLDMHSLLYGDPRFRDRVAFFSGDVPPAVRAFKSGVHSSSNGCEAAVSAELDRCIAALRRGGHDAVVIDVTPADIADLGFIVVRAVVADLHPLWGGHQLRCLGGSRVRTVPVTLGYHEAPRSSELNTDPHPMP